MLNVKASWTGRARHNPRILTIFLIAFFIILLLTNFDTAVEFYDNAAFSIHPRYSLKENCDIFLLIDKYYIGTYYSLF